jgi:hypothetical protein
MTVTDDNICVGCFFSFCGGGLKNDDIIMKFIALVYIHLHHLIYNMHYRKSSVSTPDKNPVLPPGKHPDVRESGVRI